MLFQPVFQALKFFKKFPAAKIGHGQIKKNNIRQALGICYVFFHIFNDHTAIESIGSLLACFIVVKHRPHDIMIDRIIVN